MAEEVKTAAAEGESGSKNFIDAFIEEDIAEGGRFQGQQVHTRFPPEPNGYLHIGHCKALTIDFGTAERFGGLCNLRMDDTNPTKEDVEFVDAIKEDIHWLGFDWGDRFFYGSDYFEKDYEYAVELIKKGLAYVCDLTPEEAKEYRGDIGKPAVSPYRDRDVEENLDLFERMKNGEFPEGSRTLRAKIDLASGNFNMRDPVIYRIRYMHHHRQGDKWCIYPMYDFAHPIQDALEGITHSLCSLEFEAHRPLYDWVVNNVSVPCKPRQIEFARLGIDHTVMSKRKLRKLVEEGIVSGWDDPRMPTLCGLRRRGYTSHAIRDFCETETSFGNMYPVGKSICAWYAGWKSIAFTRLGRKEEARMILEECAADTGCFSELFEIHETGSHPWFTTAEGVFLEAVMELQNAR